LGTADDLRRIDAAVAVELIHLGSLYHDDVIDESTSRRGTTSANANWDNTVAILAGDFLMARASEIAASTLGQQAVQLLARTYAELVEGQTLELQLDWDIGHGPDEYYRVIGGKTASLIRTSATLGAMAAEVEPDVVDLIGQWAWDVGLVFQISDDALDLVATDEFLGKPAGSDVREGKFTLPVLYALDGRDGEHLAELLSRDRPYDDATVEAVIEQVRDGGHIDRTLKEASALLDRASGSLDLLPKSPALTVLRNLGVYLLNRVEAARD
jgi:heptaprenyl diphosphate synthase